MIRLIKSRVARMLRQTLGLRRFDHWTLALGINPLHRSNLHEMELIRPIFTTRFGPQLPPFTLLDVGANRGLWTRAFSQKFPTRAAHLFEPNTLVAFELLGSPPTPVHLNRCGVSSAPGQANIRISNYPGVTSSIGQKQVYADSGTSVDIDLVSLDSYFADKDKDKELQSPVVLKIDVEGHDMAVLQGASGLFDKGRIDYVVIEIGFNRNDAFHSHFLDVHNLLAEKGFAFCSFTEQFCVRNGAFYGMQWGNAVFARQFA